MVIMVMGVNSGKVSEPGVHPLHRAPQSRRQPVLDRQAWNAA